jgi:hypothetical protein
VPQSRIKITKPLSRTPSPGKSLAWVLVSSTQVMGRLHLQHPNHPRMAKFPKAPKAESYRSCHPSSSFIILHLHPLSFIASCCPSQTIPKPACDIMRYHPRAVLNSAPRRSRGPCPCSGCPRPVVSGCQQGARPAASERC